jgi:ABC-type multidrug transport system fused ATPase/permease subunit
VDRVIVLDKGRIAEDGSFREPQESNEVDEEVV